MIKHRFAFLTATMLGLITVFGFAPHASAQGAGIFELVGFDLAGRGARAGGDSGPQPLHGNLGPAQRGARAMREGLPGSRSQRDRLLDEHAYQNVPRDSVHDTPFLTSPARYRIPV